MNWLPLVAIFSLSVLGVVGDCFLKVASQEPQISFKSKWFVLGVLTFAAAAFGWVYAFRHFKVASIGMIYSVSTAILLIAVGVIGFNERLTTSEVKNGLQDSHSDPPLVMDALYVPTPFRSSAPKQHTH